MTTTASTGSSTGSTTAPERAGSTPPGAGSRLALLDSLRFVAAAMVLLFHFTARTTSAWDAPTTELFPTLHPFSRYGYLGVDLFFFISGFVVLMTAWGRDVPSFVASRVGRLFPAYWTGVLLTGGLLLATGTILKDISPADVLTNLTMVQAAYGVPHVDGAYWTLWVELRFYLVLGLLALVGINRNRVIALALLWPVLAAAAALEGGGGFLGTLLLPEQAPLFATGMLLFLAAREGLTPGLAVLIGWDLALSMTFAYGDLGFGRNSGSEVNGLVAAGLVLVLFLLVAAVTLTPLRRVSWGWLTTLGALTYPLYVLHEYWGFFVIKLVHPHLSAPLTVVCAAVVSLAMAAAVHRLVEKPLGPRLRRAVLACFDRPVPRAG